jgi:hypothetical protein
LFGKGAVFPDGTLVTWAIEGGKPFHDTVRALLGRDDRMPVVLWIKPGGQVSTYPDPAVPVVPISSSFYGSTMPTSASWLTRVSTSAETHAAERPVPRLAVAPMREKQRFRTDC